MWFWEILSEMGEPGICIDFWWSCFFEYWCFSMWNFKYSTPLLSNVDIDGSKWYSNLTPVHSPAVRLVDQRNFCCAETLSSHFLLCWGSSSTLTDLYLKTSLSSAISKFQWAHSTWPGYGRAVSVAVSLLVTSNWYWPGTNASPLVTHKSQVLACTMMHGSKTYAGSVPIHWRRKEDRLWSNLPVLECRSVTLSLTS